MKQKYTLSVADMHVNVVTEASRETIDKIVGMLDRKMREITLNSKKCPKNEAALLCALEFCADKLAIKEEIEALEESIACKDKELALAEQRIAKLEEENAKLRASDENNKVVEQKPEIIDTDIVEPVVDVPEVAPVSKKKSRNKVGSMFDLLTFSDI